MGTHCEQAHCRHLGSTANAVLLTLAVGHQALPFVSQVNSLHVASPVEAVLQLQDCSVFLKIIDGM